MEKTQYKVIGISNFDDPFISDILIATGITDRQVCNDIAEMLNSKTGSGSTYFYRAVREDYVLYEFQP